MSKLSVNVEIVNVDELKEKIDEVVGKIKELEILLNDLNEIELYFSVGSKENK